MAITHHFPVTSASVPHLYTATKGGAYSFTLISCTECCSAGGAQGLLCAAKKQTLCSSRNRLLLRWRGEDTPVPLVCCEGIVAYFKKHRRAF